MDLHQLEYIVEIARQQNISKAAESLHISQPTLSIYLTKLEKGLGIKLFTRTNNVLTITAEGEKYAETCRQILALRDQLYAQLYPPKEETIRMGVLSSSAAVFNNAFGIFRQKYPQVILQPQIGKSQQIYEDLLEGKIDLGFITSYESNLETCFEHVNYTVMKDYELMLCIAKSNPVYKKLHLENEMIQKEDLKLLDELNIAVAEVPMIQERVLGGLVPTLGLHPKNVLALNALEFWSSNLCLEPVYCFSPYSHVPENIAQIPLSFHPKIQKLLIYPKGKRLTSAQEAFVHIAQEEFEKYPYYYYL